VSDTFNNAKEITDYLKSENLLEATSNTKSNLNYFWTCLNKSFNMCYGKMDCTTINPISYASEVRELTNVCLNNNMSEDKLGCTEKMAAKDCTLDCTFRNYVNAESQSLIDIYLWFQ